VNKSNLKAQNIPNITVALYFTVHALHFWCTYPW